MKQKIKIIVLFIFICGSAFVFTRNGQMQAKQSDGKKTAAEVYKNIQVLKDMPADQLDRVMVIFSGSLGVKCSFCHVQEQWEKDDKEEKKTAREMIKMTLAINKENFGGRTEVSCATCHAGKSHPSSLPPLGQNAFQALHTHEPTKETLPTIDTVLDKYIAALGGKAAVEKITTRVSKGSRIGADGVAVPEEVYQKSPNKILVVTSYPQNVITNLTNDANVWATNGKGESRRLEGDEAEQFRREAQLFQPTRLKEIYKNMSVVGAEKIGDKDVYLVRALTQTGGRERLYFDKQNGLLVRRFAVSPTVIGAFTFQVDYADYKTFDGVQVPTTVQWSIPGRVWSRKITDVKQNTAIDDTKFNEPKK